eukprot:31471-Pelagococcus_subviridis.AAC.10
MALRIRRYDRKYEGTFEGRASGSIIHFPEVPPYNVVPSVLYVYGSPSVEVNCSPSSALALPSKVRTEVSYFRKYFRRYNRALLL